MYGKGKKRTFSTKLFAQSAKITTSNKVIAGMQKLNYKRAFQRRKNNAAIKKVIKKLPIVYRGNQTVKKYFSKKSLNASKKLKFSFQRTLYKQKVARHFTF